MSKRRDSRHSPVVAWANQQIVALCAGSEHPAVLCIDVAVVVIGAGKAGRYANVAGDVLIELSIETVVVLFLAGKGHGRSIEGRAAILVECRGVVVSALICV